MIAFAAWILLIAYLSQGDLTQACAYGELAVEQAPTPADKAWAGSALAWAWCRTGEAQRGVETLAQIATTLQGAGFVWGETFTALMLGEGYWLAGEYDSFERSMAILQQIGAENELALAYAGYGRLHHQHGDVAQGCVYLRRALAIFERLGTLPEPERLRQLLALQEGVC